MFAGGFNRPGSTVPSSGQTARLALSRFQWRSNVSAGYGSWAVRSLSTEALAALIESLDVEVDEKAEEKWREEIHLRLQQVDSGAVNMISWDDARRKLRDCLRL